MNLLKKSLIAVVALFCISTAGSLFAENEPHTVEVNLDAKVARVTISPAHEVDAWTYNGDIPGPLIRAQVGDRLIVHFTNHLPAPTTVHWHGIRLPFAMDGVPDVSQPEVPPGGSFTYDFILPDAGLFWYHPHVMSAMEVGYGLYGALLVEDPRENVGVADEKVLVLSDISLEDDGSLMSPAGAGVAAKVFGLEGNHLLVNGREQPKLTARAGVPQRWRVVNTAKSRYFELQIGEPKDGIKFTVIGGDGGLQEYATVQDTLVVVPGERMDAIVIPRGAPGSEIPVTALVYDRGYGSGYDGTHDLFTVALNGSPPPSNTVSPQPAFNIRRSIEPISPRGATDIQIGLTLVQIDEKHIEYRLNNVPSEKSKPISASVGETQIWTIKNDTEWSHPIHLHGFFFQVLDDNGDPVRPIAWKDTADVPFKKTLRLIVRYDDRPGAEGMWMFHCHILDHAEGGLMGMVEVGHHHHSN